MRDLSAPLDSVQGWPRCLRSCPRALGTSVSCRPWLCTRRLGSTYPCLRWHTQFSVSMLRTAPTTAGRCTPVYRTTNRRVPKVVLFYWDARDGRELSGWWFGDKIGGGQVGWACCFSRTDLLWRTWMCVDFFRVVPCGVHTSLVSSCRHGRSVACLEALVTRV